LQGLTEQVFSSTLLRVQKVSALCIAVARLLKSSLIDYIIILFSDGFFNLFQASERTLSFFYLDSYGMCIYGLLTACWPGSGTSSRLWFSEPRCCWSRGRKVGRN
jgi:hypothetical protein